MKFQYLTKPPLSIPHSTRRPLPQPSTLKKRTDCELLSVNRNILEKENIRVEIFLVKTCRFLQYFSHMFRLPMFQDIPGSLLCKGYSKLAK